MWVCCATSVANLVLVQYMEMSHQLEMGPNPNRTIIRDSCASTANSDAQISDHLAL